MCWDTHYETEWNHDWKERTKFTKEEERLQQQIKFKKGAASIENSTGQVKKQTTRNTRPGRQRNQRVGGKATTKEKRQTVSVDKKYRKKIEPRKMLRREKPRHYGTKTMEKVRIRPC